MRPWTVLGVAVTSGVSAVVVVRLLGLSDSTLELVSNLVMSASATLAFVACTLAARRSAGRRRAMWTWMAVGTGAWTAGQAVYSYYALVLGVAVPFPSPADATFLTFPVAASVGMVVWLGSHGHQLAARGRDVLDGAIIAGSLLVISWVTALGAAAGAGGTWFALTVSLAYPVGDLVLVTLVFMALVRGAPRERFTLGVLALGLGGVSISDSAYVYSLNQATPWPEDVFGMGWFFGFLFVAAAAISAKSAEVVPVDRGTETSAHADLTPPSLLRLALPYLPLVAALAAFVASVVRAPGGPDAGLLLGVALVLIVLTRQFLAMLENFRLILAVQEARDQLRHQATHDPLTGLPNRVLFADRLDRALLEPAANVSVLFCDLDDFKQVNDKFGHETGDLLLRTLAERMLACVRITDTVCRLGGDEFALLLIDSPDPAEITGRVLSSLSEPVDIGGNTISISVSIGVAHHHGPATPLGDRRWPASQPVQRTARPGPDPASTRATTARLLMRAADSAMYVAKDAGKGQAVFAGTATAHDTAGAGVTGAAGP